VRGRRLGGGGRGGKKERPMAEAKIQNRRGTTNIEGGVKDPARKKRKQGLGFSDGGKGSLS